MATDQPSPHASTSETIQLILPVALKEVFEAISPLFIAETSARFEVTMMLNPEVPGHIASGAPWSMALSNPSYIAEIVARTPCLGGVRPVGYSPLSIALRGVDDASPLTRADDIAEFLCGVETLAVTTGGTLSVRLPTLGSCPTRRGTERG